MKNLIIISITLISQAAFSQTAVEQALLNDPLKEYTSLNQAYHLNNRCKSLGAEKTAIFNRNYSRISIQMHNDIRRINLLTEVEEAGKKAADLEVLKDCGDKALKIIDNAYKHSINWNAQIDNIKKSSSAKKVDPLVNYGTLFSAWQMNKKCNLLSQQDKADFSLSMKAIHRSLSDQKILDKEKFQKLQNQYGYIANKELYASCGAVTENAVKNSKNHAIKWANEVIAKHMATVNKASNPTP